MGVDCNLEETENMGCLCSVPVCVCMCVCVCVCVCIGHCTNNPCSRSLFQICVRVRMLDRLFNFHNG